MNTEVRESTSFYKFHDTFTGDGVLKKAVDRHTITENESKIIREFITERKVTGSIGKARHIAIVYNLLVWKRFLKVEFQNATVSGIYQAIEDLKSATNSRGRKFKQNTIRDYILILKHLCLWMIENNYCTLPKDKIKKVKPPQKDFNTTSPDEILGMDEIKTMVEKCTSVRDRAMLMTLYESGCRIGELARLKWGDLKWDEHGIGMYITDEKTQKFRYTKLILSRSYLGQLANELPDKPGEKEYVFTSHGTTRPMSYYAMRARLEKARGRAGIAKRIHAHLYRKSRITHLVKGNWQESIIKKTMWGNLDTGMFKVYVVLSEKDIDAEVLEQNGIEQKKEKKKNPLAPIPCMNCHFINGPTLKYCGQCGYPLTEEEQQSIEQKIRIARERREFKTILDITGYLPDEKG